MINETILNDRILILDGAMGTMIQQYNLTEEDYRGTLFANSSKQQKGNNDLLSITQPAIIKAIHIQYLEAGADVIETNTFNANRISMADYGMTDYIREMNLAAVRLAREAADEYTAKNPNKPRFVAGSIGPTNKTASISPNISDLALRNITFDELQAAYREQIDALIEGGVDALLIETVFDTLNLKAALIAAEQSLLESGKEISIMVSFTIVGKSGRILSGQTIEAALASISHAKLLSVGLNCSFGASDMKSFLKELARIAPCYISAHPNAGLPNNLGQYDETPEKMAPQIKEYIDENLVNIVGGCCGTTPAHIAAIAAVVEKATGKRRAKGNGQRATDELVLSGLETLSFAHRLIPFTLIGERCNVAGSRKFLRLIKEKKYGEALGIARKQVEDGAQVLDVNLDDGLLDGVTEMTTFLNMMASDPDIIRVPVMIDSSNWKVIEAGLKCLQGKSIVNSISLKNGEADFLEKARIVRSYGAAVIAMAFDEKGQADTFERKIEIAAREYRLLTEQAGFPPYDIIFDPNVLAVATGIEEHAGYALNFIRAVEWIKTNLPGAKVSGGISNLSFSFRGNDRLREAMHAVFLYHCIGKGLDMGIVNPSSSVLYEDIDAELLTLIEDVIFNRRSDAAERLTDYAQQNTFTKEEKEDKRETWRTLPLSERLQYALVKGIEDYLEQDLTEAMQTYAKPIEIIDGPLMEGMNTVGNLFGAGKMFLPQVVKTARTMKKAVSIIQPAIEAGRGEVIQKVGKILIATVKGDVHDIGKNITAVVLACNNYDIIDLGVMVPPEVIIQNAKKHNVDLVALSGLITPSLQEMTVVASEMEKAGFSVPLMIGGATTSKLHTALKIDPYYHGAVVHVPDASLAVPAANQLLNPETKSEYIRTVKNKYEVLRGQSSKKELVPLDYARKHPFAIDWSKHQSFAPSFMGTKIFPYLPVKEIVPYINWAAYLTAWKFPAKYGKYMRLKTGAEKQTWLLDSEREGNPKAEEAARLMDDTQKILQDWAEHDTGFIKALIGFYPVTRDSETIRVAGINIPFLRQQERREDDRYKSLADFFHPDGDYIGFFVVTAGSNTMEKVCDCGRSHDPDAYTDMIKQILRDRLAEAATEYLHESVRKTWWGYNPNEAYAPEELPHAPVPGIRPASGYPSHPDISLNFVIDSLLNMKQIGVELTPNGAMNPPATTSGIFISNPESEYFMVGGIDEEQLSDYAVRKGVTVDEARKWLAGVI
ncbi:MAG: methionine synthase [Dysgonamonadaceae bacterium]|jgi:5-methyltetrahydrofolate--homocysteine methyltransferase|nr:methionine synthase [Dysgonamonadaceae bacterium]